MKDKTPLETAQKLEAAEARLAEAEKVMNEWLDYHAKKYRGVHVCRLCRETSEALAEIRGTDA